MSIIDPQKKVALASDHAGYEMKMMIEGYLDSQNIAYTDFGTHSAESCDYPDLPTRPPRLWRAASAIRASRCAAPATALP